MSLWCQGFPTVTVPQGAEPKHVTYVYPYYENANFLAKQVGWWHGYPADLKERISVIVVDDGSPKYPAVDVLRGLGRPFPIRLFRIEVDIAWNGLAARNIGAKEAVDGWLLMADIDHVVPAARFSTDGGSTYDISTPRSIVYGKHDPKIVYAFDRVNPQGGRTKRDGSPLGPHSASFLMTKAMFWRIGGYDETFSGGYGTDGMYRQRLAKHAPIHLLTDRLVLHEYDGDSSTDNDTYKRKQPSDAARKARIKASLPANHQPKVLSFAYHEVAL